MAGCELLRWLTRLSAAVLMSLVSTAFAAPPLREVIDSEIRSVWQREKITPAGPASDAEFLRRVSLDLVGVIPTHDETVAFFADPSLEKWRQLIDRLLDEPRINFRVGIFQRVGSQTHFNGGRRRAAALQGFDMPDFNPQNPKQLWQLPFQNRNEGAWPMAVAFLGSDRRIAAGDRDGRLLIWDVPEPNDIPSIEPQQKTPGDAPSPKLSLVGHTNGISRLAITPDGKTLISTSFDRTIRFWDVAASPSGSTEIVVDHELRDAEARRSGKNVPAEAPGTKVESIAAAHTLEGHKDWIDALSLNADGKFVISAGRDTVVRICQVEDGKEVGQLGKPRGGQFKDWTSSIALSPDQRTLAATDISGWVHVWTFG